MSHCPYLIHKFFRYYLFVYYSVSIVYSTELPISISIYRGVAVPLPSGFIWLWLWNIQYNGTQPYYCWWTYSYCIKTIVPQAPLTYLLSEKKALHYQLCSTHYVAERITNCLKRTFVIKVATMKIALKLQCAIVLWLLLSHVVNLWRYQVITTLIYSKDIKSSTYCSM